jgi:hypothetical protein
MTAHTHEGTRLTFGCPACIQVAKPTVPVVADFSLSAGQRLTARNKLMIERGKHPATHRPIVLGATCGQCANHVAVHHHNGIYHKCRLGLYGLSHSTASDIRVSWPSCELFEEEAQT